MFTALGKELEDIIAFKTNQSPGTYRNYRDINFEAKEASPPELPTGPPPKIYALIIGIDQYRNPAHVLSGAVADADAIDHYIRTNFPSAEIQNLRNEKATRSAIKNGIRDLGKNPKIREKDPILIFYAGHGSETTAPKDWVAQGQKIQMLMPQDYNNDETFITDIAFAKLLEELATKKGDNIVVILDCCHSGSMTRLEGEPLPPGRNRVIQVEKTLSEDVDYDILGGGGIRAAAKSKGFQYHGTSSHVLLAACGENELAQENGGRGLFTRAFLDTINSIGYEKLTYAGLIRKFPSLNKYQTPRCEGVHRDRFFFDPKPPPRGRTFYEADVEEGKWVVVRAGAAHGITDGAEFTLYPSADATEISSGPFRVRHVKATSSVLEVSDIASIPSPAFALQTKIRAQDAMRVCFANKLDPHQIREKLTQDLDTEESTLERCAFVERDQAQVEVDIEENAFIFNILNSPVTALGISRLPYQIKLEEGGPACDLACNVIRAAARFERYLGYAPENEVLRQHVEVEYLKVERKSKQKYGPVTQSGDNLCKHNHVEITAGPTKYGIKIINKSTIQLYPHLFLFDCSDLSIECYYRPPTVSGQDTAAPLQPGGSLTIGYGTGGQNPWEHYVRDEETNGNVLQEKQDFDIGVFKLFLTTQPTDLGVIVQTTPFSPGDRQTVKFSWGERDEWDALSTVVVVERRKGLLDWSKFAKILESVLTRPSTS